jgi:hypothetical protein
VVDEARDVAADVGVAAPVRLTLNTQMDPRFRYSSSRRSHSAPVAKQFAGVVDDPRVFRDGLGRENAVAVNERTAPDDFRKRG